MNWLNYHHLLYFWTVARTGSITRASEELMLSPPTVCAQLRALEKSLGAKLLERRGRTLALTETGEVVQRYAEGIFSLGRELVASVQQQPGDRPLRLAVGIEEALPKLIVRAILKPALELARPMHLVCREGTDEQLLADLAAYRLDMVLTDHPARATSVNARAFSHLLGESGVVIMAAPDLAGILREDFPRSLNGAPALLPTEHTSLRWTLDRWFESAGVQPQVVGECDDPALANVFGADGFGFFAVHSIVADQIARQHGVEQVGEIEGQVERFYAITGERRLKHEAVLAVATAAREVMLS